MSGRAPAEGRVHARVRPATVLDAQGAARVHLAGWHETYGDRVPPEVYAAREASLPGEWESLLTDPGPNQTWVAERDGEVVGIVTARAVGPGHVRPLELRLLYVLAAEQGRRTGYHLLATALGDAPCFLWVVEGNERAERFYRRQGFEYDGERREVAAGGHLPELRMVR